MGWRSKLIFLMIVYFAGFATAVYYLAPDGRNSISYLCGQTGVDERPGDGNPGDGSTFAGLYDRAAAKARASFSGMSSEEFKEKFRLGMQKLREMARNSRTTASQSAAEGG